jgi:hypothetical protein
LGRTHKYNSHKANKIRTKNQETRKKSNLKKLFKNQIIFLIAVPLGRDRIKLWVRALAKLSKAFFLAEALSLLPIIPLVKTNGNE